MSNGNTVDFDENQTTETSRFANPLAVAWRRKGVVLLGMTIALVIGVLYYSQRPPAYQSTSQVLVVKKGADASPSPGGNSVSQVFYEDYLSTHTVLLRSQELLRRAGRILESKAPEVLPPGSDAGSFIGQGLSVIRENRDGNSSPSNVLNIAFRGRNAEHCPKVVAAVIDAYQSFLDETYQNLNLDLIKQMERTQQKLLKEIEAKKEEHDRIAALDPYALQAKDAFGTLQERIVKLEAKRAELLLRKSEIETREAAIAKSLKDGQSRTVVMKMIEQHLPLKATNSPAVKTPDDVLLVLQLQEEELQTDLGKDHPQLVSLRRRIQSMRERLSRPAAADDPAAKMDPLELYLQAIRYEVEENESLRKTLEGILSIDRAAATSKAEYLYKEEKARKAIDPLLAQHDQIDARLRLTSPTGESSGFRAKIIAEAGPGVKVAPSIIQTGALAMALGLCLGLAFAYLAEWSDKGFQTPDEIHRRLGLPVMGNVPLLQAAAGADEELADGHIRALHSPSSRQAEAFRGLRTAIFYSTRGRDHQVIQMTSPNMGDGKSTLVANLAVSIAQSGKSVVLIDADFRRPSIHKLFRLKNPQVGLASALLGEADLPDIVCPGPVPGLSIIPCGPRPTNPAELLTSPRFQEMLRLLRERYDFVLVDTPPLLVVSDPAVVAPRMDGVLLALRLTKQCRPSAERAKEVLNSLGVKVLGVVVNGMTPTGFQGGYGYYYQQQYTEDYMDDDGDTMNEVKAQAAKHSRNGTAAPSSI